MRSTSRQRRRSSNAGAWAAASAARRASRHCSPASPRCSRETTGRPVKLRVDRDDDMLITGKRHDFVTDYEVGFDDDGRILGVDFVLAGALRLLGRPVGLDQRPRDVPQRQLLLPRERRASCRFRCKTNTVSNTAFRGFGGPQGMIGIEQVIDDIARHLGNGSAGRCAA